MNFEGKEIEGEWWLPERPEEKFPGVLKIDETNRGILKIKGPESKMMKFWAYYCRVIHGQGESHYKYSFTLLRITRRDSSTIENADERISEVIIHCSNILIGGYVASEEDLVISAACIRISGLEEWCDESGFSGSIKNAGATHGTEEVNLIYKGRATPLFSIKPSGKIRFVSYYCGPRFFGFPRKISMHEESKIELHFDDNISIKNAMREFSIWQTFLTFALRRPSYLLEVRLALKSNKARTRDEQPDFCYSLLVPIHKKEDLSHRHVSEILFTQSKLGDRLEHFLKGWRLNYDIIEIPIMLFSGTFYQEGAYIHTKLLAYLQALEVLHCETVGGSRFPDKQTGKMVLEALRSAIPKTIDCSLANQISNQVSFIGYLTLLDRLKYFFDSYPNSLKSLFPDGHKDMALLKDVRNHLTHYSSSKKFGRDFLWSQQLIVLAEKTKLFLEVCFLGILGMSDNEIESLMKKFEVYNHFSWEKHK